MVSGHANRHASWKNWKVAVLYSRLAILSEGCRIGSNRKIRTNDIIYDIDFFVSLLFIFS